MFKDFDHRGFIDNYFQKSPIKFSIIDKNIVSWRDVNNLLESDILDYPRIRLANNQNVMSRGFKGFVKYNLSPTGEASPHINRFVLNSSLKDGATLIVDRAHNLLPKINDVVMFLQENFHGRSAGNLYCSWTETASFGLHFDNHDVFAIQIEGRKKWDIHNPTHKHPMLDEKSFDYEPPKGEPEMQFEIGEGEGIYIPAGYWHNVVTDSDCSMHVSFPLVRPRKIDLVRMVLDSLSEFEELREPLPYKPDGSHCSELKQIISTVIQHEDFSIWERLLIERTKTGSYVKFDFPSLEA